MTYIQYFVSAPCKVSAWAVSPHSVYIRAVSFVWHRASSTRITPILETIKWWSEYRWSVVTVNHAYFNLSSLTWHLHEQLSLCPRPDNFSQWHSTKGGSNHSQLLILSLIVQIDITLYDFPRHWKKKALHFVLIHMFVMLVSSGNIIYPEVNTPSHLRSREQN